MNLNKRYKTDKSKELEGTVIDYTDDLGNVIAWFKCKRPGGRNTEFQKVFNRKLKENRQEIVANENEDLSNRILAEVFAEAVILDWGGDIEGPDGEMPAECTKENIIWLFSEEAPDLFRDLSKRLEYRSRWQAEEKAGAGKNSKPVSTTSSGGDRKKKSSKKDGDKASAPQ